VQHAHVAAERLEVERARHVERVEEPLGVRERERCERRRERVVVEQRDALLRSGREAVECAVREISVRRQIGHPDRAERAHDRQRAVVQPSHEMFDELGPHAGRAAREAVDHEQELRTDDVVRRRLALADAVLEDQPPVELRELVRADARPLAGTHLQRQPVDERLACERPLDDCTRRPDPLEHARGQRHRLAAARDPKELVEREAGAGERDRHLAHSFAQARGSCSRAS